MQDFFISCLNFSVVQSLTFLYFQVNPNMINRFEEKDLCFVGQDVDGKRMEIIELTSKWVLCF